MRCDYWLRCLYQWYFNLHDRARSSNCEFWEDLSSIKVEHIFPHGRATSRRKGSRRVWKRHKKPRARYIFIDSPLSRFQSIPSDSACIELFCMESSSPLSHADVSSLFRRADSAFWSTASQTYPRNLIPEGNACTPFSRVFHTNNQVH